MMGLGRIGVPVNLSDIDNVSTFLRLYIKDALNSTVRRNTGTHQNTLITNSNHWNTLWILAMGIGSPTIWLETHCPGILVTPRLF